MLKQPTPFNPRQIMCCGDYEMQHKLDTELRGVALHYHDFYEFLYLVSGDVTYSVANRVYRVMPGDLLFIAPRELHSVSIRSEMAPYERYVLWLTPTFVESLSSPASSLLSLFTVDPGHTRLLRLPSSERRSLRDCMEAILQERKLDADSFGYDLMAPALITQLLVCFGRIACEQGIDPEFEHPNTAAILATNIADYLNLHYAEPLRLDQLAEQFLVSKYHLSHTFSKQLGISVCHYVQKKRLQIARQLLAQGTKPGDACIQCGFSSYASFFRSFKAEYSIGPREYADTVCQQTTKKGKILHV